MNITSQIMAQRTRLEQAVSQALSIAQKGCDSAEVAVSRTTGMSEVQEDSAEMDAM